MRIIDVDLEHPLFVAPDRPMPTGEMGMLIVSGPSVFPGYIGFDGPQPFVEREGKPWYVTGDLAHADTDRFLYFRGR